MGPQADGVRIQVSINDERLFTHNIFSAVFIKLRKFMIKDGVHTENTDETDVRKRTVLENSNCHQLDSN